MVKMASKQMALLARDENLDELEVGPGPAAWGRVQRTLQVEILRPLSS